VQLIGLCVGLEDLYIITEFVNGGSLHSKLEDKSIPLDWKTRVAILRDVSLAMTYLHAKGKMHRDLKSHNLLVTADWKVKVCDFGLARSTDGEGGGGGNKTIVGTNEWMAPEVLAGDNYDSSADVFSYAMVIWELLTRTDPPVRRPGTGYAFLPDNYKSKIPPETPPKLWELLVDCAKAEGKDRPDFKAVTARIKEVYEAVERDPPAVSSGASSTTTTTKAPEAKPKPAPTASSPTTTTTSSPTVTAPATTTGKKTTTKKTKEPKKKEKKPKKKEDKKTTKKTSKK